MTLLAGIILAVVSLAFFVRSLPKDGRTAKFVGGQSEGYIVVTLICFFGLGLMLAITGFSSLIKG
jgi:hypothetical protein